MNNIMKKTVLVNLLLSGFLIFGAFSMTGCGSSDSVNEVIDEPVVDDPNVGIDDPIVEDPTPPVAVLESTTVTTTSGKVIKVNRTADGLIFEGHEGKIVLLEMYGWNCPFCVEAIPGYNRLKNEYPDDVYIITIETYGTIDNAGMQNYVAQYGVQYDTVAKQLGGKIESFVQTLTGYSVLAHGVPSLLVLDKSGSLFEYLPPQELPETYVKSLIEGLL